MDAFAYSLYTRLVIRRQYDKWKLHIRAAEMSIKLLYLPVLFSRGLTQFFKLMSMYTDI